MRTLIVQEDGTLIEESTGEPRVFTLREAKDIAWGTMKRIREAKKLAPILMTPFGAVDSDEDAVDNIEKTLAGWKAALDLGVAIPSVEWTLADNTTVTLTYQNLQQITVMLLQRGQQAFALARTLRAAIEAATTAEEIEAVAWPP